MHTLLPVLMVVTSWHVVSATLTFPCSTGPDPEYPGGKRVDCSGRGLSRVPDGIPGDTTTLILSRNILTLLRANAFTGLTKLKQLDVSSNKINSLQPSAFKGLARLVRLDMSGNELPLSPQVYPTDLFAPLVSLQTLLLNYNSRRVVMSSKPSGPSEIQPNLPARNLKTEGNIPARNMNIKANIPVQNFKTEANVPTQSLKTEAKVFVQNLKNETNVTAQNLKAETKFPAQNHTLMFASESGRVQPGLLRQTKLTQRRLRAARDTQTTPRAPSQSVRSPGQRDKQDVQLGYPDQALSHLPALTYLAMDGLTNRSLGAGFTHLTRLTHLDMNGRTGHCKLVTFNVATMAALPHLTHLNLSDCDVTNLTPDAFSSLRNLTSLDLSFNQALGFDLLGEAFLGLSYTQLISLTIDAVVPARSLGVIIKKEQLRLFGNLTRLERVQARFNRIEAFEAGALCGGMPPNLREVVVNGNLFQLAPYVNDLACLTSLTTLDISGLDAFWTPPLRPPDDVSPDDVSPRDLTTHALTPHDLAAHDLTPRDLTSYDVTRNSYARRPKAVDAENVWPGAVTSRGTTNPPLECEGRQFSVPPRLQTLMAKDFGLVYKLKKVKVNATNSLRRLDLSQNHFPELVGPLCGFQHVEELYLMNCIITYINFEFFDSFPALRVLNVSANFLRWVFQHDVTGRMLQGLSHLRVLDLSLNDLGHLPNKTLIHLSSLQELYLSVNGLGSFFLDLSGMGSLQHLDVAKNQLRTIPKDTRDHLDRVALTYNVTINMTFNPISCICHNINFLQWMRESLVYFGTHSDYWCQQPDGSLIALENIMDRIQQLEYTCTNFTGAFVGAAALCVVVVTLLLAALAYRFRWKLRYLYYASRLSLQRLKRQQPQHQQQFHYDAFVSFATEDQDFVMGELRSRLEDDQGLRLCIHTRDFTPGQYIASNIVDSVQRSRRTLVLVSHALLESDWCHYELQMALMESVHTGRDVLLFLLYEHVPTHQLSRDMLANLQATSYIEFPEEEEDRGVFWSRLGQALRA